MLKFQKLSNTYRQIEVGSQYAGLAFHAGSALPSRMSFFYPVANSIDNSTNYWTRHTSRLINIQLACKNNSRTVGYEPHLAEYTPYCFRAKRCYDDYEIHYEYSFGNSLPVVTLAITLTNTSSVADEYALDIAPELAMHCCHSYDRFQPEYLSSAEHSLIAHYPHKIELGNCALFFVDCSSSASYIDTSESAPTLHYQFALGARQAITLVLAIGCCRHEDTTSITQRVFTNWRSDTVQNATRVADYISNNGSLRTRCPALNETAAWAKAVHASLLHYFNGRVLAMPCPAEYNFFFTHDFLVHGLGWGFLDINYLKNGYQFLISLNNGDDVLSHACYWKDSDYFSEPCPPTDWNNLWLIISIASYYKHSGDDETVLKLLPTMLTGLGRMLEHCHNGLMYAYFPDWWDFGTNYGPRSYMSILTYRAIQSILFLALRLDLPLEVEKLHMTAEQIYRALNKDLWSTDQDYLLNRLSNGELDKHYYSGALLAPYFGLLSSARADKLLDSARNNALDSNCGVRNVSPADFSALEAEYGFKPGEQGADGYYINGGVWSQCNAWYALSLISQNRVEEAYEIVVKHLTLDGIKSSLGGQPSFYEARITAPDSNYGAIDKPTFLWHSGWFMLTLYELLGIHENAWNIELRSSTVSSLAESTAVIFNNGKECSISFAGTGEYFKTITVDGALAHSAILPRSAECVLLERGTPQSPYLANAACIINKVVWEKNARQLTVHSNQVSGKPTSFELVVPPNSTLLAHESYTAMDISSQNHVAKTYRVISSSTCVTLQITEK